MGACSKRNHKKQGLQEFVMGPEPHEHISTVMCTTVVLAIFLLIAISIPLVQGIRSDLPFSASSIESNISISGSLSLIAVGPRANVERAKAELLLFPRSDQNQRIVSIVTSPSTTIGDQTIDFNWDQPAISTLTFSVNAQLVNALAQGHVTQMTAFPIESLPPEFVPYTLPTENIDVTPEIYSLAQQLSTGKTDLYEVEHALAGWVRENIHYDLSSLGATSVQKSSDILAERQGVCTDLTSLFISLNRAIGVPARFVSGVAYTNLETFPKSWVPHAWAEVYFPGSGWIPFDPTYGEFGYVDAGHIVLERSQDSKDTSSTYEVRASQADFRAGDLVIDVLPSHIASPLDFGLQVKTSVLGSRVRFGSYNLIYVEIQNQQDFYQIAELDVSDTTNLSIHKPDKTVLLHPHETRKIPILVRVDAYLDPSYVYTFPVTVEVQGKNSTISFEAQQRGALYNQEDLLSAISQQASVNVQNLSVACQPVGLLKPRVMISVNCTVSSSDTSGGEVIVCIKEQCEKLVLPTDANHATVSFQLPAYQAGVHVLAVSATRENVILSSLLVLAVPDAPALSITDLHIPPTLDYDEEGDITFTLMLNSSSIPKGVKVRVEGTNFHQSWDVGDMPAPQLFDLTLQGKTIGLGASPVQIGVSYQDDAGRNYSEEATGTIALGQATLPEKAFLWISGVGSWIEKALTGN